MRDGQTNRQPSQPGNGQVPPGRASGNDTNPVPAEEIWLLSAWLDDQASLDSAEQARVQRLLEESPAHRQALAELRELTAGLSRLPELRPDRSFQLTPELAGEPSRLKPARLTPGWPERRIAALRWATAAVALVFILVVGADVATNRPGQDAGQPALTMDAPEQSNSADLESAPEDARLAEEPAATAATEAFQQMDEPEPESDDSTDSQSALEESMPAEDMAPMVAEDEAQPSDGQDSAANAETETTMSQETALDEAGVQTGSDRQAWRVAQVGLAILLTILVTLLAVLSRRGRHRAA
jgi:hypothetical protein